MVMIFDLLSLQVSEMLRSRHVSSLMDDHDQIAISQIVSSNSYALRVSEMLRSHHMSSLMDDHDQIAISHIASSNSYAL